MSYVLLFFVLFTFFRFKHALIYFYVSLVSFVLILAWLGTLVALLPYAKEALIYAAVATEDAASIMGIAIAKNDTVQLNSTSFELVTASYESIELTSTQASPV